MAVIASNLVTAELTRRGIAFVVDNGGLFLRHEGRQLSLDLTNLQRRLDLTGDASDIGFFVDAVLSDPLGSVNPMHVFWLLEPASSTGVRVSPRLDRVVAQVSEDNGLIQFLPDQPPEIADRAWTNLDRELAASELQIDHLDGVPIGLVATEFVSKASLILAPGLRQFVESSLGWPVLAMVPDRDFLFLCNAEQQSVLPKLGGAVVREYDRAPYPLSTEVFRVDDILTALGAFGPDPSA